MSIDKVCVKCKETKLISEFYKGRNACKSCKIQDSKSYYSSHKENKTEYDKQYKAANKNSISDYNQEYYEDNKEYLNTKSKEYYISNKDKILPINAQYRKDHKEEIALYKNDWQKNKTENDPTFRLHRNISVLVRDGLKSTGGSKNGHSILEYLWPTYFDDLKLHLQSQWEYWMTWDNWTIYDPKTWDDNNSSTWTW